MPQAYFFLSARRRRETRRRRSARRARRFFRGKKTEEWEDFHWGEKSGFLTAMRGELPGDDRYPFPALRGTISSFFSVPLCSLCNSHTHPPHTPLPP